MSTQPAPSPWSLSRVSEYDDIIFCGDDHGYVAVMNKARVDWQENRSLILAAPAMLSALKALTEGAGTCGYDCEQRKVMEGMKLAEAAIAKAEGGITINRPARVESKMAPPGESTCNDVLRSKGYAYPRTCAECGLGPCKNTHTESTGVGMNGVEF